MHIVVELFHIPVHELLRAASALLRPLQGVKMHLALVEQEVAQQRHERHGDSERAENEEGDGQAEVLKDLTRDAAGEASGRNTATVVRVEAVSESVTSFVPSTQLVMRSCPSDAQR